jgi:Domain of unknown function (DUF4189)
LQPLIFHNYFLILSKAPMMQTMKAALSLCFSLFLMASSGAYAAGAIAVDDEVGETDAGYGIITGADSREEAARDALKECRKSGNTDCKVVVRFDQCGAYAASKKYAGIGYGGSLEKAKSMALDACGNSSCKIVVADCE